MSLEEMQGMIIAIFIFTLITMLTTLILVIFNYIATYQKSDVERLNVKILSYKRQIFEQEFINENNDLKIKDLEKNIERLKEENEDLKVNVHVKQKPTKCDKIRLKRVLHLKTSSKGLELIKQFEGCKLKAYLCPAGVWTIGYGHTATAKQGMTITQAKAVELLKSDLARFEASVNAYVKVPINQNQFDALVSFSFNVGSGALKSSTLLRKLNARDYNGAAEEFKRWNKAGGKVLAGLVKRREAERALFLAKCDFKVGDIVYLSGHVYVDSFASIKGAYFSNKKVKITKIVDLNRKAPYLVDSLGWVSKGSLHF